MKAFNLIGIDGNAFSIMGYTSNAMKQAGFTQEDIQKYRKEAMSGDYAHLLCVSVDKVEKCNEILGLEDDWEEEDEDE